MQKRIIIGAIAILSLGFFLRVFSVPGRAQGVEQANAALAKTERGLANEVTKGTGQ